MKLRFPFAGAPAIPVSAVVVLLCALAGGAAAQEPDAELRSARARLQAARVAALHLIAPRSYELAVRRLELAEERQARGEAPGAIRRALDEAEEALSEVERLGEVGRALFRAALEIRRRAMEVDAPRLVADNWAVAERELLEGGRRLERGDRAGAEARGKAAAPLYREAALDALRLSVLGTARQSREWAVAVQAYRWAPATLAEADRLLSEADGLLLGDSAQLADAARLGSAAARTYRRAARIAAAADSVQRRELAVETIVRRQEEALADVARQLDLELELGAGAESVAREAGAAIRGLQADRENLERQLARREAELREARERFDSLETHLASVESREARLAADLRERERRERRLREVRAIFTPQEGEVLVRGDTLTIRLYGLTFETGSDEIRPEQYPLLTKLQQVLREFPGARITVEGHTDSRGNDEANRALSQQRAIAVREHLLTSMAISSSRITAVGLGEERPIASNETATGREKNRRIEVILDLARR
ncbi:MAG: OmpA family protein [Gemmatimonadota bacterium]